MKNNSKSVTEKPEYNQYWYSESTVKTIVDELKLLSPSRVACLSTPTVFFAASHAGIFCDLFEFDIGMASQSWVGQETNKFILYDFRCLDICTSLWGKYDVVVADPPFITLDALGSYMRHTKQLLFPGGKIIFSSIAENLKDLENLFGSQLYPVTFQPSIPSLVYQYELFVNYILSEASGFTQKNPEVH